MPSPQKGNRHAGRVALALAVVASAMSLVGCESNSEDPPPEPAAPQPADTTPPTVPTNLIATPTSATRIVLAWQPSTDSGGSGLAGYQVFRDGNATPIASPTTNSYADMTAVGNTAYAYQVRAVDTAGNISAVSNTANATTPVSGDITPPTAPANVAATAISATRVDLTWQASTDTGGSGVTSYRIFRNGSTTVLATVTGTTHSDTTATAATAYTYQVRAVDAAGNISTLSNTASATTPAVSDTTAPTVPAAVTASAISATRIDLSWQASTDTGGTGVANYRIFRNGSTTALATVSGTTHSDTTVAAATAYTYQVRAVDVAGNVSALSNTASATTPSAPTTGLDTRPSNTTCLAWDRPTTGNSISLVRAFPQLPNFSNPVAMLQAPGNSSRWYVVEQEGYVRVFDNTANVTTSSLFIDVTDRVNADGSEQGLLGMAFHPNYPADPRVFLSYTATGSSTPFVSRISSFRTTNGGTSLDRTTETIVLAINDPNQYHNGGNIAFHPTNGFLYIGIGDGGSGNDPFFEPVGMGQRLTHMLGKILRIDVDGTPPMGQTYRIPSTNPFSGNAVCPASGRATGSCPEIFAFGFRNPWRWSFDRQTGDLWVGDVGQDAREEVDFVELGKNYGWRCREGTLNTGLTCGTAPPTELIDPVAEYDHTEGVSITGGYVYRGTQTSSLQGRYIFADFAAGQVYAWIPGGAARVPTPLVDAGFNISSFGEDNNGELYVVNYNGSLHRILFQPGTGGGTVPTMLSNTGCFTGNPARPVSGLIPYDINAPFWSDGLNKERYIGLPNGTSIAVQSDGDWEFPNRTVLVKSFRLGTQLIETRLFMRHGDDGTWSGYTYEWTTQNNATRVQGGSVKTLSNGQQWIFPSEAECLQCHSAVTGRTLGPETAQMNRDFAYPAPGRTANQLLTHSFIATVTPPYPADPQSSVSMPNPADTSADLTQRARAYLHTNCSQCHRPGSGIAQMDLRYAASFVATNTCNALAQTSNLSEMGMPPESRIVVPTSPSTSVLLNRMNRRDTHGMPRLGSRLVDDAGVALISTWITQLTACN